MMKLVRMRLGDFEPVLSIQQSSAWTVQLVLRRYRRRLSFVEGVLKRSKGFHLLYQLPISFFGEVLPFQKSRLHWKWIANG